MSHLVHSEIVLETEKYRYELRVEHDEWPEEPSWGWYSTYAPTARHFKGDGPPDVWTLDAPLKLQAKIDRYSRFDEIHASDYAQVYRHQDPSGIYLVGRYDNDRYSSDAITIYTDPADEEREGGNILIYAERARILRNNPGKQRVTKQMRADYLDAMMSTLRAWNAWANGECYQWELRRYEIGGHGFDTIDAASGYYGDDEEELAYMRELALESAQVSIEAQQQARAASFSAESGMELIAL